jgi:threonylcarbamoyladenosine tRNA methylthiotransferase MtaB
MLKHMRNYKVYTIGCKVAQAEGDQAKRLLDRFGSEASLGDTPDLCVVSSCAVTSTAAGKSRRLILKLARLYPDAKIILLGCYATIVDDSLKHLPQLVLIADHHRGIMSALEQYLLQEHSGKSLSANGDGNIQGDTTYNPYIKTVFDSKVKNKFPTNSPIPQDRHRAFLKVQDGCNANCTYCIIPRFRPKIQSEGEDDVLARARALVHAGHKELVLTGIFLGAYGKTTTRKNRFDTPGQPLVGLIDNLLQINELERLRLSSLEPMDLTADLLKVLSSSNKVAGHLHLSLQAGSDNVLRRMGRQYRSAEYLRAIENARSLLPDVAMTTDVIVGFPGETEDDFKKTLEVCEKAEFMKIHIFPFSPRPDTPAWNWRDEMIQHDALENRLQRLRDLEDRLARRFRDGFLNRSVRVLVEKVEEKDGMCYAQGRADQYFLVRFPGRPELDNEVCTVKILDSAEEPLKGEQID